jgi:hypothetical protein
VAQLTQAVRVAGRHTVFFHEAVADRLGLSAADSRALSYLQETGPVPAGMLAELTGLTTGAVTGMIDRLERAGLVRRDRDPEDRRKVIVAPVANPPRAPAAERLFAPLGEAFAVLIARYTNAQLAILVDFVSQASAMLRDQTKVAGARGAFTASSAKVRRPASERKSP